MLTAKIVLVKNLNNVKHAKNKGVSPQHVNKDKNVKSKTASPPKARMKTFVPKPKQKYVKAVYKVKGTQSLKKSMLFRTRLLVPLRGGWRHLYQSLNRNLLRLFTR